MTMIRAAKVNVGATRFVSPASGCAVFACSLVACLAQLVASSEAQDVEWATRTPGGRWSHAMAFDIARGRAVVFDGFLAQTWEWDGGPPARTTRCRSTS